MRINARPLALLALAVGLLASCNDREAHVLPPNPKPVGQANHKAIAQPEAEILPRPDSGLAVDGAKLRRLGLHLAVTSPIAPGVTRRAFTGRSTGGKPIYANAVDFDLADSRYEARVAVASGPGPSHRESTRRMAAKLGALVGINGSYFNFGRGPLDGVPIGLVVSGGRLIKSGRGNRPALAIGVDGSAAIGLPPAGGIRVAERAALPRKISKTISRSDWLGSLLAFANDETAQTSTTTDAGPALAPAPWGRLRDALEGGPVLLAAGEPANVVGSGFGWSIESGREPRTAVGLTPAGRMVWVTVDGRVPGHSQGMTLAELTGLFQALGVSDALNWDGGGSTTLIINGRLITRIATGWVRPVSNALVLLPRGGKIKRS